MPSSRSSQISPSQFIRKFHLSSLGFSSAVQLTDATHGFTTRRDYKKIADKEYVSFTTVIVNSEATNSQGYLALVIQIDLTESRGGSYLLSNVLENTIKKPINVISTEDYYVNLSTGIFYTAESKEIQAREILEQVYDLHIKPTKQIKGLIIRAKLISKLAFAKFLVIAQIANNHMLWGITGEWYEYDHFTMVMMDGSSQKAQNTMPSNTSDSTTSIQEFKARTHTIIFFCGAHLLLFIAYQWNIGSLRLLGEFLQMKSFLKSSLLSVIYAIFVLGVMDRVYPKIAKSLQRSLAKKEWQVRYGQIKL